MSDQRDPSRWSYQRKRRRAFLAGREAGGSDLSSSSSSSEEPPKRCREDDVSDVGESDQEQDADNEQDDEEQEAEDEEQEGEDEEGEDDEEEGLDEEETVEEEEDIVALENNGHANGGVQADANIDGYVDAQEGQNLVDGVQANAYDGQAAHGEDQNVAGGQANHEHDDLLDVESDEDDSDSEESSSSSSEEEESESENQSGSDSEEEREDRAEELEDGDEPLYENARLSKLQSIMMILTLALTFNLSGECISKILELIELHCPIQNRCVKTLYMFKKVFRDIGRNILALHYYCERCYKKLNSKSSICTQCGDETQVAFFLEIPIINQLQRLFLKPGFIENLRYRFDRQKKNADNIEDIQDGRLYREQMDSGFLRNRFNLSFMWYTDGIRLFKSVRYSVWPLFFVINELSYKLRTQKENIILAGLWFGKSKPKPNLFLSPFRETLDVLRHVGYQLEVPEGPPVNVKGVVLCGTCDLQAKGLFLRMKLSNGYYGCHLCYSAGERAAAGTTTVHVHRYIRPEDMRLRSNNDVPALAAQRRMGHKGLSLLYVLMPSMVKGTAIDCMHMIFCGLSKLMTTLWFDTRFSGQPFSCANMYDVVCARLSSIKPPSFIQRLTRTLADLKLWKAREHKLWFFYYSLVVMNGVLENVYLHHHLKLVSAIALLSMDSISHAQIDAADRLLNEYVHDFQALYSVRFMGMNVHMLLHLAEMVRDIGPLWVVSCFFLEDMNGQLVKLVHGPYQPGLQICSSASLFLSLKSNIVKLPPLSAARIFCEKLNAIGSKYTTAEVITAKLRILGRKAFDLDVSAATVQLLQDQHNIVGGHFQLFFSLRKDGVNFTCEKRVSSVKRCSMFACFIRNEILTLAKIKEFVRHSDCQCEKICSCLPSNYFCIAQKYVRIPWYVHTVRNSRLAYLSAVESTNEIVAFTCDEIKTICFYFSIDNVEYIATPVNRLEYE